MKTERIEKNVWWMVDVEMSTSNLLPDQRALVSGYGVLVYHSIHFKLLHVCRPENPFHL